MIFRFQAVDQPDLYETNELPESDQHQDFDVSFTKAPANFNYDRTISCLD